MSKFRKINLSISKGNGYGQYIVSAKYRGKNINAHTTDSEAFDYLENPDNKEKHLEAKRHCYYKIVSEFRKTFGY